MVEEEFSNPQVPRSLKEYILSKRKLRNTKTAVTLGGMAGHLTGKAVESAVELVSRARESLTPKDRPEPIPFRPRTPNS